LLRHLESPTTIFYQSVWMSESSFGRCPVLVETMTSLDALMIDVFNAPKVEAATKIGISQKNTGGRISYKIGALVNEFHL
jgi:hypothetical protein